MSDRATPDGTRREEETMNDQRRPPFAPSDPRRGSVAGCGFETCRRPAVAYAPLRLDRRVVEWRSACERHLGGAEL